jgi:hypothetical protein
VGDHARMPAAVRFAFLASVPLARMAKVAHRVPFVLGGEDDEVQQVVRASFGRHEV